MSSGVPILPTGIIDMPALSISSGMESDISDLIKPGATALGAANIAGTDTAAVDAGTSSLFDRKGCS